MLAASFLYVAREQVGGITMMRKCFWPVFLVSVCLALSGAYVTQAQEVENLVQNAGFEDGVVAPWTMWVEDSAAVATMTIDNEEKLTGDHSLLIDVSKEGSGQRVELHQNPFVLENNQELTYALWAKTEGGSRPARMIVNHRADPWTSYAFKEITVTEEWTEFWAPVVMTADDDMVGIYVELRDTVGKVWFDNFRLYEGEYIEEDLEGMQAATVEPRGKLVSTWAAAKSAH